MTAKTYLQQIYNIQQQIDRLRRRRDAIRADLYSLGSPAGQIETDRVQTSNMMGDRMLKLVAQADELDQGIVYEIGRLQRKREQIAREIESLPNERYRKLLFERYVVCRKWPQIAAILSTTDQPLDLRWVYRMHGDALKMFHDYCMGTKKI